MTSLEKAVQTQLANIQKKTGMSLKELAVLVKESGLSKHGEIRDMFKEKLGLGHGDANTLVHAIFESDGTRAGWYRLAAQTVRTIQYRRSHAQLERRAKRTFRQQESKPLGQRQFRASQRAMCLYPEKCRDVLLQKFLP